MKIDALTSLRFIAALMVVLSHLGFMGESDLLLFRALYEYVFHEGYIGVTFFFILSGFILSYSYAQRLREQSISKLDFYKARIARIYPLHLVTFILAIPLINIGDWLPLLSNLGLMQSFIPDARFFFSANAPSWSLSNEMFFYVLFPFLLFYKKRTLIVIGVSIAVFQIVVVASGLSQGKVHYLVYIFPVSRLMDFIVGILIFRLYSHLDHTKMNERATTFQCVSIAIFVFFFTLKNSVPGGLRYDLYYVLPMSLIILSFAYGKGKVAALISTRSMVLLGNASFALYLLHQLIIRYIERINASEYQFSGVLWDSTMILSVLLISIISSVVMYKFFEVKANRKVKSLLITAR